MIPYVGEICKYTKKPRRNKGVGCVNIWRLIKPRVSNGHEHGHIFVNGHPSQTAWPAMSPGAFRKSWKLENSRNGPPRRRSWSGFRREYEKKLARFFCKIIFVECAPSNHMLVAEWRSVFANGPVPPKVNGILGVVPPTFCNQVQWQNRVHNLPLYFTRKDMIKLNQPSSGRAWRRVRPFAAYSPCPALSSCESSRSPW